MKILLTVDVDILLDGIRSLLSLLTVLGSSSAFH